MTIIVNGEEQLSIQQLADELGLTWRTVRAAIRRGELEAHIIGGRDPLRSGRGLGYRITRQAGHEWYFGKQSLPKDGYKPVKPKQPKKEARPT